MNEIRTAKRTSNKRPNAFPLNLNLSIAPDMRKNITIAQFDECKFNPIRMCTKILKSMKGLPVKKQHQGPYLSEKAECFVHVRIFVLATSTTFNGFQERLTNILCTCRPPTIVVCNIIFDASTRIDFEFAPIDRSTKARVVLACVSIVSIVLWIVNMFLRTINTESLFRYLFNLVNGGKRNTYFK